MRKLLLVFILAGLSACPSGESTEVKPISTGTVSKSIDLSGGKLEAVSEDGVTLQIEFPAGATRTPLVIKVVPRVAEAEKLAAFEITPKGARFRKPVTLKLKLPSNVVTNTKTNFFFRSATEAVPLETRFDAASKTFTTSSNLLGFGDVVRSTQTREEFFDALELATIDCQRERDFLVDQILLKQTWVTGFAPDTKRLETRVKSLKARCDDLDGTEEQIRQIQNKACAEARKAVVNAGAVLIESAADLEKALRSTFNTQGIVLASGANCPTADYEVTVSNKFKAFADLYNDKVNRPDFKPNHEQLWTELASTIGILGNCLLLEIQDSTCETIKSSVKTLFDIQRKATYKICQEDGSQFYLANLASFGALIRRTIEPFNTDIASTRIKPRGFPTFNETLLEFANFTAEDIENDLQYCASRINLTVIGPLKTLPDLGRALSGGATPGLFTAKETTKSPVVGSLELSGSIRTFDCNSRPADDQLVIKLNGIALKHIPHIGGEFLKTPIRLTLLADDLLTVNDTDIQKAGIDTKQKSTALLQIFRSGESCEGRFSDGDFKLFEFAIEFDPKPKLLAVTHTPTSINASDLFTKQTFNLEYEEFGENLKLVEDRFALLPNGGSGIETTPPNIYKMTAPNGIGTRTIDVRVRCSEAPKSPKRDTFKLIDQFDQESESVTVSTSISYSNC
jgi:hypothetical protein